MQEYKGMKIGDVITAFHKGYHEVVAIEQVPNITFPKFTYKTIADATGKRRNGGKVNYCYANVCAPANIALDKQIKELKESIIRLQTIKASL